VTVDRRARLRESPFAFRATRAGIVFITWQAKTVTTLRGAAADTFLRKIAVLDDQDAQLLMAKATGHFKHGNESSEKLRD